MASDGNKRVVTIQSILGGKSPMTHLAAEDQFRASLGIDPSKGIADSSVDEMSDVASGLIRPMPVLQLGTFSTTPLWATGVRGTSQVYVLGANGSLFSVGASVTDMSDGGTLTSGGGNGLAYYDNYLYIAKNTDIARFGPLDSADPAFDGSYWVTTLGLTALTDSSYPVSSQGPGLTQLPNHFLHRHSDGRLYIADVVGNQGTIHFVETTKTTVEGDTDNGSTYNKIQFGYGLYPTAIASYGDQLVVAFAEVGDASGSTATDSGERAKVAFWDTTSAKANNLIWSEFSDPMILALKNINGVLYAISGNSYGYGLRVSQYLGGSSFKEIGYFENIAPTYPGAIAGAANRLLFGSNTFAPEPAPCIYSMGLQKASMGNGLFIPFRGSSASSTAMVTAMYLRESSGLRSHNPISFWGDDYESDVGGADTFTTDYATYPASWWSQIYRIGRPFKITKIRIPLATKMTGAMGMTIKVYTDDGDGTTYTLATANNTNDDTKSVIVRRSDSSSNPILAQSNFWIELRWTGATLCVVGLPITIEYEFTDDT